MAFYDFPAKHWAHIRSTNPIESTFATVRLRSRKTKGCGSVNATVAMVFKLMKDAEKRWKKLRGYQLMADVIDINVRFVDGERILRKTKYWIATLKYGFDLLVVMGLIVGRDSRFKSFPTIRKYLKEIISHTNHPIKVCTAIITSFKMLRISLKSCIY